LGFAAEQAVEAADRPGTAAHRLSARRSTDEAAMLHLEFSMDAAEIVREATIHHSTQTVAQNDYASGLYSRIDEAKYVRRVELSIGSWEPPANDCHANATILSRRDSRFFPVRGWLYFDFGGLLEYVIFLAHSVVRVPNGEMWDITPIEGSQEYPFLPATESEKEFAALVQSGVVRLWHRK
jgi:hypothetical protein